MIDPRELMIGNWVGMNLKEIPNNYLQVVEVGLTMKLNDGVHDAFFDCSDIEPIPLTSDFLYNIFAYSNGLSWAHSDEYNEISIEDDDGLFQVNWYGNFIKHIDSVHELQNIHFQLTNQELKIEDFG